MNISCKVKFNLLVIISLVMTGCGKKVENSTVETQTNFAQAEFIYPTSININLAFEQEKSLSNYRYEFEANAWVSIPQAEEIQIKSGDPEHFRVRIYFNSNDSKTLVDAQETYCEYLTVKVRDISGASNYKSQFKGCYEDVDFDGEPDPMSYSPGLEIVQEKDKYIRFVFEYGFSNQPTEVETKLNISDWF